MKLFICLNEILFDFQRTALSIAVERGDTEIINLFLQNEKIDVNYKFISNLIFIKFFSSFLNLISLAILYNSKIFIFYHIFILFFKIEFLIFYIS